MKHETLIVIAALAGMLCSQVAAAEPYVHCEDDKRCVAVMAEGQPAPFDGQLLSVEAAVGLRLRILTATTTAQVKLERERRLHEEELRYERRLHEIDLSASQEKTDLWRREAKAAHDELGAWWRHPALWFTLGVVAAGATVAVTGYALSALP